MDQRRILARLTQASSLLLSAFVMVGCATPPASNAPPGPQAVTQEAHVPDGPPQISASSPGLKSSRPDAGQRKRLVQRAGPENAFPSALPKAVAKPDEMVAHFIDVGQGDAVLLEFSCAAVLIDTGGELTNEVTGRKRLAAYLQAFFLRRPELANTLKLVVLSHPHKDHTDGVTALLEATPPIVIENVVDNGATDKGSGIAGQRKLQKYAKDAGAGYAGITETDITSTAGMTSDVVDPVDCRSGGGVDPQIVALWGRVDLNLPWANDANNDSVVLRVDFGKASFLFTGDLEKEGIDAMLESYEVDRSIFNVDVLKVGHHGSYNATTNALIAAVTPKVAVIQAGNAALSRDLFSAYSFGHPHQDAVAMLLDAQNGASMPRKAKDVQVGVRGRNPSTGAPPEFKTITVNRALYTTGWDGGIAVSANKDGTIKVETGF